MKKLRVLGVCAGQGALLFPFRKHLIGNIEIRGVFHTPGEEQWKANFGDIPFHKGFCLQEFDKKVDIILSSPDCGHSSVMRLSKVKELGNPKDNRSLNLVIAAILEYKPKIFLIENLPRLLSLLSRDFFEKTFKDYKLIFHERSVSDYGNSQVSRKRLIILGVHKKTGKKYLNAFDEVFQVKTPKLTRDLLFVSPYGSNYNIPIEKTLAMYDYRKLPEKKNLTVEKIQVLWNSAFKNEKKWPIKTAKMSTLPGVYRLELDKPPLTLRPADRQFRPDGYPLGIKDFKAIMGFPKKFKIYMDKANYLYCLNKARYTIAKGSVFEIAIWFKRCLKRAESGK
nr:MAG: C-5 cytosine-specific DNA methylase [Bacteriophage sp.]